jgi:hypothetical protein
LAAEAENFFGDEDGEDEVIAELEERFGDGLSFEEELDDEV